MSLLTYYLLTYFTYREPIVRCLSPLVQVCLRKMLPAGVAHGLGARAHAAAPAWLTPPLVLLGFAAVPALLVYGPRLLSSLRKWLTRSPQLAGIALILTVVVLWTASSVAIQLVFEHHRFAKPVFLTYASACLLMVYLPFYPDRLRDLAAFVAERLGCGGRRRGGGRRHVARYSRLEAAGDAVSDHAAASADDAGDAPVAAAPLGTAESVGVALRVRGRAVVRAQPELQRVAAALLRLVSHHHLGDLLHLDAAHRRGARA